MLRRPLFFVFSLAVLVNGVGCGPKVKLKTVPVSGTVTYNGQPVEGATVLLIPSEAGSIKPAGGDTGANGKFTLQTSVGGAEVAPGAMPGEYKVTVSKVVSARPQPVYDPNNPKPLESQEEKRDDSRLQEMQGKALLPSKYGDASTSGLTASVKADGKNELSFELKDD